MENYVKISTCFLFLFMSLLFISCETQDSEEPIETQEVESADEELDTKATPNGRQVYIISKRTGKALTQKDGRIVLHSFKKRIQQRWREVHIGGSFYSYVNVSGSSNNAITSYPQEDYSFIDDDYIYLRTFNNSQNQHWLKKGVGNGYFQLIKKYHIGVLSDVGGAYLDYPSENGHWKIIPIN